MEDAASFTDLMGRIVSSSAVESDADRPSLGIHNLVKVVLQHVGPGAEFAVDDVTSVSDPEIFERIESTVEELLKADLENAGELQTLRDQLSALGAAAREQKRRYEELMDSVVDIAKPQLTFPPMSVDNGRFAVFKPQVPDDRLMPLEAEGDLVQFAHPYEREIMHLGYAAAQLQPPLSGKRRTDFEAALVSLKFVTTEEGLEALVNEVLALAAEGQPVEIAVDLEHHSFRSFRGLTCIMQLSTRAQDYVIDMLALRGRVSAHLGKLFMNENFVKVLHGADHDVIWLQRDAGLYLVNYFDTAIAAKELAYKSHSLAHLLEKHCAVQKDKKMQLADWRVRPLSEEMMRYALSDTFYLLDIYAQLRIELHAKGSASAVQAVLEASKEVALRRYEHERFNASGYLGVLSKIRPPAGSAPKSPSDRLDWDLQEKCLAALWDWRDAVARYEDESVGYTLSVTNMLLLSRLYFEKNRAKAASKGNMMEDVELSDLRGALSPLPTLVETYKEHMVRLLNAAATSNDAEIAAVLSEYDVDEGDIVEDLRSTFKTPRRRPTDPELDDEMQEVQILSGARPPRSSQAFSQASTPLPLLNAANTAELTRFRTSTSPFVFTPPPIGPSFETSLSFDGTTSPTMRVAQPSPVLGTAALYSQAGWSIQVEEDAKPGSEASLKPASGFALGDEARLEGVDEAKADSVRKGLNREPLFSLSVADFLEESAETDTKNILEAVLGSIVTGEEEMDTDVAKADDGAEADGTTDGAADEGATIPQSLEEIYHVSNRNRKRNKDKKKLKYMTQEEAQAFLAKRGPAEGGVKGVQQSQIVREMSSEKRIVASKEDTINFMEAIGWINSEQRDSLRETYVANAHQGGPGSSAGGMPGSGPGMGMGAAGGAPVAGQGSGMAAGGGPGVGYHGNQQRQRHPAGNARPQMNATANAAYRGNTGNRYDRTLAAIGAFGGTGAAMGQGDAPGGPREKPKVNANPFLPAQGFNRGGQRNSGAKQGHHRGGGGRRNQRDGRSMTYRSYQH